MIQCLDLQNTNCGWCMDRKSVRTNHVGCAFRHRGAGIKHTLPNFPTRMILHFLLALHFLCNGLGPSERHKLVTLHIVNFGRHYLLNALSSFLKSICPGLWERCGAFLLLDLETPFCPLTSGSSSDCGNGS